MARRPPNKQSEPERTPRASPTVAPRRFSPLRTRRIFEEICEQIRRDMAASKLRPGDKLPAERDLAQQFGVSRNAVREALRSLEVAGIVRLQKGVKGGAIVLQGNPDLITRSIRDMFFLGRISLDSLTEARTHVMQMAIALAVQRMTPDILSALEENNARFASLSRWARMAERAVIGQEFYVLIGKATRNEVIVMMVEALTAIVMQEVVDYNFAVLASTIDSRKRLIAHLKKRDSAAATREITDHLQSLHRHLIRERNKRSQADKNVA
jgi:GntR family transcriptional repressor for pyruvate dehydrogenase complex